MEVLNLVFLYWADCQDYHYKNIVNQNYRAGSLNPPIEGCFDYRAICEMLLSQKLKLSENRIFE